MGQGKIDLNADVGESFGAYKLGLDDELIPWITSANIACGWHAGDPATMRRTLSLAKRHGISSGAHPGFPDLLGFGRRNLDATLEEIEDYVTYQVGALAGMAAAQGIRLQHVKPHGALYNMAAKDPRIWESFAKVISRLDKQLILVVLAGPHREALEEIGQSHGVRIAFEFFADRAYNPDGTLVSRKEPGAVIHDPKVASERALRMVSEGKVVSRDGKEMSLAADTICLHGDNPSAVALARVIRETLTRSGVEVAPMGTFL